MPIRYLSSFPSLTNYSIFDRDDFASLFSKQLIATDTCILVIFNLLKDIGYIDESFHEN